MITPDDPRHGTYAGLVAHQKTGVAPCPACRAAGAKTRKAWRLDTHRNGPRTVPLGERAWRIACATPVLQLVRETGLAAETIHRMRRVGPGQVVKRSTRDRVLAAGIPTAIGVQRRLRALCAAGWSMQEVATFVGTTHADNYRKLLIRSNVKYVRESMAQAITNAYSTLASLNPPDERSASRSRNRARSNGWAPPSAWIDVDIDDPEAQPDPGWRPRGYGDKADLVEDFDWLVSQGESAELAAERLGVQVATIRTYRRDLEREDAA